MRQGSKSPDSALHIEPNQSYYQQAVRNQSVRQRCVFDDARKHCGQKLCSVSMLHDCVEIFC